VTAAREDGMPVGSRDFGDDEEDEKDLGGSASSRFREFDCPSCNANNPVDDGFGDSEEILCNYCGTQYRVKVTDEGRLKLKEL
jgi:hypothetical protein